jgi:hypothetical protein
MDRVSRELAISTEEMSMTHWANRITSTGTVNMPNTRPQLRKPARL